MKKSLVSLVAASLLAVPAMAEDVKAKKDPNAASISGTFKVMHIVDSAFTGTTSPNNKLDPSTGSAALLNIKYKTKSVNGLSAVFNHYTLTDTGLTGEDTSGNGITDGNEKVAKGMFINYNSNGTAEFSILGEAYLNYKTKSDDLRLGRQIWKTPLTTIKFSTMPSFFQGASYNKKLGKSLSFHAAHMTKMALGARAWADGTLIGEGTNTAGAYASSSSVGHTQGEFMSMARLAGSTVDESSGMSAVGLNYKKGKGLKARAWVYSIDSLATNTYADVDYKMPLNKKTKLIIGAQYLNQAVETSSVTAESSFDLAGAKLGIAGKLGNRKYMLAYAMNESHGQEFFNVWGADPAYTSTIFSRNEYREDVEASKITAKIGIVKGLTLVVGAATYTKSKTTAGSNNPTNDATETDIVLVYKPNKKFMFKIFNAQRKTEKDDAIGFDHTQNHTRMMAHYKF